MERKPYPTDLTDGQWRLIEPLIPAAKPGGRSREVDVREMINAILYVLRGGIPWRLLPHDFGPWTTVWTYYRNWRRDGTWKRVNDHLRSKVRKARGREESPSAAIIDTQSVKTTQQGGPRGYDAGKLVSGRKRHLVVDTEGLVLTAVVHSAGIQDRDGARSVMEQLKGRFPRLRKIWADAIYTGGLADWMKEKFGWILEIVRKAPDAKGFQVIARRWVIERTFAWLGRYRRLSKDYERLPETTEMLIYIAMANLMVHRLSPG